MSDHPVTTPAENFNMEGDAGVCARYAGQALTRICHGVSRQSGWWSRPDALADAAIRIFDMAGGQAGGKKY